MDESSRGSSAISLSLLLCRKGHERNVTRTFNCSCYFSLMFRTVTRYPSRQNFTTVCHEASEYLNALIINEICLVHAEATPFAASPPIGSLPRIAAEVVPAVISCITSRITALFPCQNFSPPIGSNEEKAGIKYARFSFLIFVNFM
jgi:hypothetical protein